MNKKRKIQILIFIASALLFILVPIYYFLISPGDPNADYIYIARELNSPSKILLNGILGHFFRFKLMGALNWLAIPFIAHFLFTIRNKSNLEIAFIVLYIITLVIIASRGYSNFRYQLTLFPITVALVLTSLWSILESKNLTWLKGPIVIGMISLIIINNVTFYYAHQLGNKDNLKSDAINLETNAVPARQNKSFLNEEKVIANKKFSKKQIKSPYPIFDFINDSITISSNVLVNNVPSLYYYTDIKGIFYISVTDRIYLESGWKNLFTDRDINEAHQYLFDTLKCGYVFSTERENKSCEAFSIFLQKKCEIVKSNKVFELSSKTYILYKINPHFSTNNNEK